MTSTTATCPACGFAGAPGSSFCEACGAPLSPAGPDSPAPGSTVAESVIADDAESALPAADPEPAQAPPETPTPAPDPALVVDDFGTPDHFGTPGGGPAAATTAAYATPTVPAVRVCSYCSGTIAPDGYCLECGEREVSPRDRFGERPTPWLAGVSDIGLVHRRNEDALALAAVTGGGAGDGGTSVVVVCDGVTTAPDSDIASLAGAQAAAAAMRNVIGTGDPRAPRRGLLTAAVRAGHQAALDAVLASTSPDIGEDDAPSCTFVACAAESGMIVAGWVGDSRAYWFPAQGEAVQLTRDHSWAAELVAEGMSEAEAAVAANAHAITRWVGRDDPGEGPEIAAIHPEVGGLLLVCSDGLWNYAPGPADLLAVMTQIAGAAHGDLAGVAGAGIETLVLGLVDWARGQGGRDNISAAIAQVGSLDAAQVPATEPGESEGAEPATIDGAPVETETERGPDGDVQR